MTTPEGSNKWLRITLKPLEPYFFGTDRTFAYDDETGGRRQAAYFMSSADEPSQTTLFGALRYLGIEDPDKGFCLCKDDEKRIGKNSFMLNKPCKDNKKFGMINSISPLYLVDSENKLYTRRPFDYKTDSKSEQYECYEEDDYKTIETDKGAKHLPKGHCSKKALQEAWICVKDGKIIHSHGSGEEPGIFLEVERVGNRKNDPQKNDLEGANSKDSDPEDGFFKKVFKFTPKHRFLFFANVNENFKVYSKIIYLGHAKSAFSVEWEECTTDSSNSDPYKEAEAGVSELLASGVIYAQSDLYLGSTTTDELYKKCSFVATKTKAMRVFKTKYDPKSSHKNRFEVGKELIRLISAGSIFRFDDENSNKNEFLEMISKDEHKHAKIAGFNKLLLGPARKEQ